MHSPHQTDINKGLHPQVPFHTGASITIGKQFYCMLQYTRFIRSGWTILATNRPDTTLAAASPADSKHQAIVLVVSNFEGAGERSQVAFQQSASTWRCRPSQSDCVAAVWRFLGLSLSVMCCMYPLVLPGGHILLLLLLQRGQTSSI